MANDAGQVYRFSMDDQDPTAEAKAAALMTDEFLIRAWQRTSGEPGDPEADALLAEIRRRELNF